MKIEKSYSIQIKVHPDSSRRAMNIKGGEIHIYTNQKPIEGRVNSDAIKILSEFFDTPKSNITLLRGEKSKNKVFLIRGDVSIGREKMAFLKEV